MQARLLKYRSLLVSLVVVGIIAMPSAASGTVIPPDDRVPQQAPNPRIVMIARQGVSNWQCTGQIYGPDDVVTAGHCVWPRNGSAYYPETFLVYPGYDANSSPAAPFGFCTATVKRAHASWRVHNNDAYDFGYLKLNCSVGNQTGFFNLSNDAVLGSDRRNIGYPIGAGKPSGASPGTAWRHIERISHSSAGQYGYLIDTSGGHSGGPVFNPANNKTFAIHVKGTGNPWFVGRNAGLRFTSTVVANYGQWGQI